MLLDMYTLARATLQETYHVLQDLAQNPTIEGGLGTFYLPTCILSFLGAFRSYASLQKLQEVRGGPEKRKKSFESKFCCFLHMTQREQSSS